MNKVNDRPKLDKLILPSTASILEAMGVINDGGIGICFIVSGRRLVGLVTDGDIRRALLNMATLEDEISSVMETAFVSLPINSPTNLIQQKLAAHKVIPILNNEGEIVDLATIMRFHQIPLTEPKLNGNELEYVTECIQSGWISSQGKYVNKFEEAFGMYVGCSNTLAVSNGTVALHLALVALGIGPGDEVIVPDLTFAASVNAVIFTGASPVLVDVDKTTMVIDPDNLNSVINSRTKAILPVHLYGYPANMTNLMALAKKHGLLVIEDCAEAIGTYWNGMHVGTFGDAATFSFYGNKTLTTGEGGMIVFRNRHICDRAKILRDHGMSVERRYWHEEIGFNYRLTNLQAAVGVAQLERVNSFVDKKRWIASQYNKLLKGVAILQLPSELGCGEGQNSYWLYTVILMNEKYTKRNKVITYLKGQGIDSRPVFYPMHEMPPYKKYALSGERYIASSYLSNGGISLPSSYTITEKEIEHVCSTLVSAL
jgi:perosamine synthetase